MATIYDLIEVTSITANTTYSLANGNLLGVVEAQPSPNLSDGEFDIGDFIVIGGVSWRIDAIREPDSNGSFVLGDGSTRTFSPGSESNLDAVFLSVSSGGVVRHFIIPNDRYGDMNIQAITTGALGNVAGSDAAIISTTDNKIEIVCFTRGTRITVAGGQDVPIEWLAPGDLVLTADHGLQPLAWIGSRCLTAHDLRAQEALRPIQIAAGALGVGLPHATLALSPQHRVLAASRIARRMFGDDEVLVAAKHLVGLDGVSNTDGIAPVEYFHILFERHEIVFANGLACESLFVGAQAYSALPPDAKAEISAIFPGIEQAGTVMSPSRQMVRGRQGRRLARRHMLNAKLLYCPHKTEPLGLGVQQSADSPAPQATHSMNVPGRDAVGPQLSLSATFMSLTR
jgi:hypothetical protein